MMLFLVATNVIASRPPERRPTGTLHACANTLKIKVFGESILFCKYLRNESSDLHEILYGGQLLSCELMFWIL